MLKNSAVQIEANWNPGTSDDVTKTISALIKKVNNPRVRTVIGKVSNISIGLTKRFKVPKTSATTRAVTRSSR